MIRNVKKGFTLIEVLFTVCILAILSAIAVPSYRNFVVRGWRTDAASVLLRNQTLMQQQYTLGNSYGTAVPAQFVTRSPATGTIHYNISAVTITPTTYSLQAVPTGTAVTGDASCGTLLIDQTGAKTVSTSRAAEDCWAGR